MKKIIITETQLKETLNKIIIESMSNIDENPMDYSSFTQGEGLKELRDAMDSNKLVSVAYVLKDGKTVRHMTLKRNIGSYVGSTKEKTDAQRNVEFNNNIKKVVDINSYIRNLKELKNAGEEIGEAKRKAAAKSWRTINLGTVLGFMAKGKFIDLRDENEIMDRFGVDIYNTLTKRMKEQLAQNHINNNENI